MVWNMNFIGYWVAHSIGVVTFLITKKNEFYPRGWELGDSQALFCREKSSATKAFQIGHISVFIKPHFVRGLQSNRAIRGPIFQVDSCTYSFPHHCRGSPQFSSIVQAFSMVIQFLRSANGFCCGKYGADVRWVIPLSLNRSWKALLINSPPLYKNTNFTNFEDWFLAIFRKRWTSWKVWDFCSIANRNWYLENHQQFSKSIFFILLKGDSWFHTGPCE